MSTFASDNKTLHIRPATKAYSDGCHFTLVATDSSGRSIGDPTAVIGANTLAIQVIPPGQGKDIILRSLFEGGRTEKLIETFEAVARGSEHIRRDATLISEPVLFSFVDRLPRRVKFRRTQAGDHGSVTRDNDSNVLATSLGSRPDSSRLYLRMTTEKDSSVSSVRCRIVRDPPYPGNTLFLDRHDAQLRTELFGSILEGEDRTSALRPIIEGDGITSYVENGLERMGSILGFAVGQTQDLRGFEPGV